MLVVSLIAGATTASTAIGLTEVANTNNNIGLSTNTNTIALLVPGIYEIIGSATMTSSVAGNYGVDIYVDGTSVGSSSIALASAASESISVPIYATISVIASTKTSFVEVQVMPSGTTPTVVSGTIGIKRIA